MLIRAAKTVIKVKNFFQFTHPNVNMKMAFSFSNNQDPFKKFKRNEKKKEPSQSKNENHFSKQEEKKQKLENLQEKPHQEMKVNMSTDKKSQIQTQKSSIPGFEKFKRKSKTEVQQQKFKKVQERPILKTQQKQKDVKKEKLAIQKNFQDKKHKTKMPKGFQMFSKNEQQNKVKSKPKQESKQNMQNINKNNLDQIQKFQQKLKNSSFSQEQKQKFDNQKKAKLQFQKIKRPNQKQIQQKLSSEQLNAIKDEFAKFKRSDKQKNKEQKQNQKKETDSQKQKEQAILNDREHSKQQIYQKTQKKKQQQKQEWQKFFEDQIKRQKNKQQQSWINAQFQKLKKQFQRPSSQNDKNIPPPIQTPQSLMKKLFLVGLAFVLLFNLGADLYSIDRSTIVSPQQLMEIVKNKPTKQTWFSKTIQSLGDESQSRTKQYVCIQLLNGEIYRCEGNDQFQIIWNRFIDKLNQEAVIYQARDVITKRSYMIKRDSHILTFIRSTLGYVLLFMFLRSIMGATKGVKGMGKGGGSMSQMFGTGAKSNRFRQSVNVKFNDVVGMNKAKQQIVQFIDFLIKPQKYNKLGARIPRGALLTGPPGTGKTMLAKACAGQGNVPFFTISGSQFMEMYVGVGAQRVRNLFKEAKQSAPSIIFIDQIDAVGKKRAAGPGGGGNSQRDNTLNQLLVEMDGFQTGTNVIVFAATNQKQVLDPALTRPGRFDRLIEVDLPDIQGRRQIFLVHLKPIVLNQNHSIEQYAKRLATLTPGFSGADIKNLCNQAAIIAARGDKKFVSMIDFQLASERIIGGVEKKSSLITPQTRKTVAYHQCGHGVVSWFLQHANPLLKLTIIPRSKGALGYAQYLPNQNQMYTRKQLMDQICVILGGRISEQIFFNKISTGASDDLQKAFKIAKTIVAQYGMSKTLNWISYTQTEYVKQYSPKIEQMIDDQILAIVHECSIKTREIIETKKQLIAKLAQQLLKVQTIDQKIISSILGERPFKNSKQYEEYIRQKNKLTDQNNQNPPSNATSEPQVNFKGMLGKYLKTSTKKVQYTHE